MTSEVLDSTAPSVDVSRYEVAIVKQAWLALNLFRNYHQINTSKTATNTSELIRDEFTFREFQQSLAARIFDRSSAEELTTTSLISTPNIDHDLFGDSHNTTKSMSDFDVDEILYDYQIEPLLQFVTIMINYLDLNMIQPGESMINLSKKNVRLYGMSSVKYQIFGECLIQTMVEKLAITDASKFQGEEQFIFNKFLSQVLSFLAYYSRDTTVTLPRDLSSKHTTKLSPYSESLYPVPTVSDNLNDEVNPTPYAKLTPPVKPVTRPSISSSHSIYTEKSSDLSLGHRHNDELSDYASEYDINSKQSSPTAKDELPLLRMSSNESIGDTYDLLNSFRCYQTPLEVNRYDQLKRSFSVTSSRESSGKKWGLFNRNKTGSRQKKSGDLQDQYKDRSKPRTGLYRVISRR
ncbi:hypothetical protein CANMA_004816 [Candida margitis]|uniref:uncharacterized protein n=1 Tax=Candida margitis TaxID=1775924 RepID=UPI00222790E5|nr:uncharacterized protein CANMA_004816 [Candida margitis]KAI5953977.1 hypothetical protein CANMA_004816 [Candida margitis]